MAIDEPKHAELTAKTVARIHVVTPRQEIRSAMPTAIREISAALKAAEITSAGPWFAHHHRPPTDTFDFDVCFPIDQPFQKSGRVECGEVATTEVARTVYRGNYEGLPQAWQELSKWLATSGMKMRGDSFEVYTIGPQENEDPAHWETELNIAIANEAGG